MPTAQEHYHFHIRHLVQFNYVFRTEKRHILHSTVYLVEFRSERQIYSTFDLRLKIIAFILSVKYQLQSAESAHVNDSWFHVANLILKIGERINNFQRVLI